MTYFAIGFILGMLVVVTFAVVKNIDDIYDTEDTDLLDYLEASKCNLFFNDQVDGGSWGALDSANSLITVGKTPRAAIANAQLMSNEVPI